MRFLHHVFLASLVLAAASASGLDFAVDSELDAVDANPGDGFCAAAGGACTLRAAVQEANALGGTHGVDLPVGTYTLTLAGPLEGDAATGDLDVVGVDLTLTGAGPGVTVVDGNDLDRVFHVASTAVVTIASLTIQGGAALDAAGNTGGGVLNSAGDLTLLDCEILGNRANHGGGLLNTGSLLMERCLVSGNTTEAGTLVAAPAGLASGTSQVSGSTSTAVIRDSTIADNGTSDFGGGVQLVNGDSFLLENVTIADNLGGEQLVIRNEDGELRNVTVSGAGEGVDVSSFDDSHVVAFSNVAFSASPACDLQTPVVRVGNNAASDLSCGFGGPLDVQDTDLLLAALADFGGPTPTQLPLAGSPLIDAGDDLTCTAADQRGEARPQDGDGTGGAACDLGAVEVVAVPEPTGAAPLWVGALALAATRAFRARRAAI